MLTAFIDYRNYLRRSGRFARNLRKSIMGAAFEGRISENALRTLRPGDVLFVQTFDSFLSWLVMYFTRSEISHVAFYVGDRQIAHSTLSGVTFEPVESLFDADIRILPCIWPMPDDKREQIVETIRRLYEGVPYGWRVALLKGLRIYVGRDWPYFRWAFLLDTALLLVFFDMPLMYILGYPVLSWLLLPYLLVISVNSIFWKIKPLKFSEDTGKPSELLTILRAQGATLMFDAYAVQQQKMNVAK